MGKLITLDHEKEDIFEIIDEATVNDLPEEINEEETKYAVKEFSTIIQSFDLGVLIGYLSIKQGKDISKVSELVEAVIDDMGWGKFFHFYLAVKETYNKGIEQAKAEAENENKEPKDQNEEVAEETTDKEKE